MPGIEGEPKRQPTETRFFPRDFSLKKIEGILEFYAYYAAQEKAGVEIQARKNIKKPEGAVTSVIPISAEKLCAANWLIGTPRRLCFSAWAGLLYYSDEVVIKTDAQKDFKPDPSLKVFREFINELQLDF